MILIHSITIALSAWLIFLVQPMVSKMLLPFLGGVPGVWNTAMFFFQLLLLLGYLYTHFTYQWFGIRWQKRIHLSLLALTIILSLPLTLHTWEPSLASTMPISWMLYALCATVGLPFFLLSAHAPMLQHWFSHTNHPKAHDPYFLYSASNLGSFTALLGYPLLIEPWLEVSMQNTIWSVAFLLFVLCLARCSMYPHQTSTHKPSIESSTTTPTWMDYGWWTLLAFVPSSLMLGVTHYITTDIASVPLLWIIPLAIYLFTFILAFAPGSPAYKPSIRAQVPLTLIVVTLLSFSIFTAFATLLLFHLFLFFAIAMVCHGQLAARRPNTTHLTHFFIAMSVGGMLGGLLNAIVAPAIFSSVIEYQLMIIVASFLIPLAQRKTCGWRSYMKDVGFAALAFGTLFLLYASFGGYVQIIYEWLELLSIPLDFNQYKSIMMAAYLLALMAFASQAHKNRLRFGLFVVALFYVVPASENAHSHILFMDRNFFGVTQVSVQEDYHKLSHGSTLHGFQKQTGPSRLEPSSYYVPLKDVFHTDLSIAKEYPFAVVGLGAGTLACYGSLNQKLDFYEINPMMAQVAMDKRYFTFLHDCPAATTVIIGDGRIELSKKPDNHYGIIIMDAYNSDAPPVHILTLEAIAGYLSKMRADGLIAFNISNRHMDFSRLLASTGAELGIDAFIKRYQRNGPDESSSVWVIFTRNLKIQKQLSEKEWLPLKNTHATKPWTDDFSSIIPLLIKGHPGTVAAPVE